MILKEKQQFDCMLCDKDILEISYFNTYIATIHERNNTLKLWNWPCKSFKCKFCSKEYPEKCELPHILEGNNTFMNVMIYLTLFYMGWVKSTPLGWLLYANPRGTPQMNWFFMTLFLSILERTWVGHFWDFFLKNPKNFTSTIFSIYNPKGRPFYTCKFLGPFGGQKW